MDATTIQWIIVGALFFIFLLISIVATIIIVYRLKWNYKYLVYENIAGTGYIPTRKGRCRLIGFGDGGEEIFYLQKIKKYRASYGKRIGKNLIAWAIGADGYWYNITFSNLDTKLLELGVMPIDRDMRYSNSAIRKGIEQNYNRETFMQKYGVIIAFGMLFLCILALGGSQYMSIKKSNEIASINVESLKIQKDVMASTNELIIKLNAFRGGTSGAVTVITPNGTIT